MPKGRPKKDAATQVAIAEAVGKAVEAVRQMEPPEDPMADLRKSLNEAISKDPEAVQKALADILGVAAGTPRTVEPRTRKIEIPKGAMEVVAPEPQEPKPAVVFASPHQGFRQVIKPSQKKYYGDGNVDIVPALVVEFEHGMARLGDEEHVKLMRAKIAKQRARGGAPQVVELRDEIADSVAAGRVVGPLVNPDPSINVNTPMSDLI